MIRDPLYRQIVEGLDGHLDPELFERCAQDLLRDDFPTLVPVRGGSDGGMDGAIADKRGKPLPLIATTAQDYLSNLTGSLQSYKKHSNRKRAVFVTSQKLSGGERQKLHEKAEEEGFTLIHICDQAGIANLLYRHPEWCKELLDLTGAPPPLSLLPSTKRQLGEEPLVGREADLKWLQVTEGDLLLIGQPGSGKTYLMYLLAQLTGALFVVSKDHQHIANGIRSQRPTAILVDDAHLDPPFLSSLARLRREIGGSFRIIANCWPGAQDEVRSHLNISGNALRSLDLLSRDEIFQVIEAMGIAWPRALQGELVDQAEGRPGLAVTLGNLCVRGDVQDVALGDALARDVRTTFQNLVGEQAVHVLAVFAVGGDAGMRMQDVAAYMELPLPDLRTTVTQLAAGGVLLEEKETLSVRPPALRHALIRDTFFAGPTSMPIDSLLAQVHPAYAVRSLVGAKARGAEVPDSLLRRLLQQTSSPDAWRDYARLGSDECRWIVEAHPDMIMTVAPQALYHFPAGAVPWLLSRAVADDRPLHCNLDHPLRIINDWIEGAEAGTAEVMKRRDALLKATLDWSGQGGDDGVAAGALASSLSPGYDFSYSDPGCGRTYTICRGCVTAEDIARIERNWPRILGFLRGTSPLTWKPIRSMVESYVFRLHAISGNVPEGAVDAMRAFGQRMLKDIVSIAGGHQGVFHWAKRTADRVDLEVTIVLDPEFETLFPVDEGRMLHGEAYQAAAAKAGMLADRWIQEGPTTVVERYERLQQAAESHECSPRLDHHALSQLAAATPDPYPWIDAFLATHLPGYLIDGFLRRVLQPPQDPKAQETVLRCIAHPETRLTAVQIVLTMNEPPDNLLAAALGNLGGLDKAIEHLAWGKAIPEEQLRLLLRHADQDIAAAAATGEWHAEPSDTVRPALEADWIVAISRSTRREWSLHKVFKARPDVALSWLVHHLQTVSEFDGGYKSREIAKGAVHALVPQQRLELLRTIPADRWWEEIIQNIVGGDSTLYRCLLDSPELKNHHLTPLRGRPEGEAWMRMAAMALDAGYDPEQIAAATRSSCWSWTGDESDMWKGWVKAYESLRSSADPRLREVGRIGLEYANNNQERATKKERRAKVHGLGFL